MKIARFCGGPAGLLLLLACPPARADLTVEVRDQTGRPVADAVVEVTGEAAAPAPPQTRIVDQRNETFVPYLELFRPGDRVVFRNSDAVRHHVYSFAPAGAFEFVLAPGQDSPPVILKKLGAIAVGCNIHDHMIAYLFVSNAGGLARTGAGGQASLALGAGAYTLKVWHPRLWPGKSAESRTVTVPAPGPAPVQAFRLRLTPDLRLRDPASSYD